MIPNIFALVVSWFACGIAGYLIGFSVARARKT